MNGIEIPTAELGLLLENVSFSHGTVRALDDVTLRLNRGKFTALLGPNGAGKSTLVALLSRLYLADAGRIEVLGIDLRQTPNAALARMGIVFQQSTLDLDLTVSQNMAYFAALHGIAGARARRRIDQSLELMSLSDRAREKARALNGGHRRRLEIARCLIHEPDFLLLDEASVGLDVPSRAALVEHVHALCADSGLTVLWTTHLVDEVWLRDDLAILHRGRVMAAGSCETVLRACGATTVLEAFEHHTRTIPEIAAAS